eukprot:1159758-Pelagomonas_calceolata.AAC.1
MEGKKKKKLLGRGKPPPYLLRKGHTAWLKKAVIQRGENCKQHIDGKDASADCKHPSKGLDAVVQQLQGTSVRQLYTCALSRMRRAGAGGACILPFSHSRLWRHGSRAGGFAEEPCCVQVSALWRILLHALPIGIILIPGVAEQNKTLFGGEAIYNGGTD